MRLIQFLSENGDRRVAKIEVDESGLRVLAGTERIYRLALEAARSGTYLEALVCSRLSHECADYDHLFSIGGCSRRSITRTPPTAW